METVYVGEIDHNSNKYFVDHVATLAENTKKLHVYSASFNTLKEAEQYKQDLVNSL